MLIKRKLTSNENSCDDMETSDMVALENNMQANSQPHRCHYDHNMRLFHLHTLLKQVQTLNFNISSLQNNVIINLCHIGTSKFQTSVF